jgi:hypothetical protein
LFHKVEIERKINFILHQGKQGSETTKFYEELMKGVDKSDFTNKVDLNLVGGTFSNKLVSINLPVEIVEKQQAQLGSSIELNCR